MCGICGYLNRDGRPASAEIIQRMHATLVHRGPDDSGQLVLGPAALGHRRLSIVDLARGHQPMTLSDAPYHIAYNGEIYNHMDLRQSDRMRERSFETTCDTETLLSAYATYGDDCVMRLNGMFAFAILDSRNNTLWLARDRMGIKPLYFYESERVFVFASEIKAILSHPEVRAEVNVEKLPVQFALKYTLDDQTLFRKIRKLLPGHTLCVDANTATTRQYWDLKFTPKHQFGSLSDAADALQDQFHRAVNRRLMADVPLGVFLSGGIDSSVIAASMARQVGEPIKAFSVAFGERDYSELSYARQVAEHISAEQREIIVTAEDWLRAWPHMVYHEDEPIAHPSSIALHFVSKLAAQEVKVVLTGEGSDELLAGYERYYQTLANLRFGKLVPGPLRSVTRSLIDLLPDGFVPKRKAVRTSLYLQQDVETLFLDNYSAMPRGTIQALLRPDLHDASIDGMYSGFRSYMQACDSDELLEQLLYADIKTYLLELLMKQDQMSMSASLESRVPFLDHELVEFACQLPVSYKLQGFQTKRILRLALGDTVPESIVTRGKKGFPTPIKEWFRGPMYESLRQLLTSEDTLCREYVCMPFVADLLERHHRGQWDLQEALWTLGNFEIWLRLFHAGQSADAIAEQLCEPLACSSFG